MIELRFTLCLWSHPDLRKPTLVRLDHQHAERAPGTSGVVAAQHGGKATLASPVTRSGLSICWDQDGQD